MSAFAEWTPFSSGHAAVLLLEGRGTDASSSRRTNDMKQYEIANEFKSLSEATWNDQVLAFDRYFDELVAHEQALDLREGFDVDGVETRH